MKIIHKKMLTALLAGSLLGAGMMVVQQEEYVEVVYAVEAIGPRTSIQSNQVGIKKMPKSLVHQDLAQDIAQVSGKVTGMYHAIPKGGLVHPSTLQAESELTDRASTMLLHGQVAFAMPADLLKTGGNTLIEGQKVDVYGGLFERNQEIVVDKLLEQVRIVAIKDAKGNDISANSSGTLPKVIVLAIEERFVGVLRTLQKVGTLDLYPSYRSYETQEECIVNAQARIWARYPYE